MQRSLFEQGKIARDRGDWDEADRCFTEASKVFDADQAEDAIANSEGLSYDLERALGLRGNRAVVEHRRGNLAAAAEMIDRSLRFTREHGTISNVTTLLVRLAAVRIDQERPEDARASAVEAHRLAAQLGMRDELEQSRRLLELLDDQDPSPQLPTPEWWSSSSSGCRRRPTYCGDRPGERYRSRPERHLARHHHRRA